MKNYLMPLSILILTIIPSAAFSQVITSNDIETDTLGQIFDGGVSGYANIIVEVSADYAHSGTKSIKLAYPNDEAGVQLQIAPFPATKSLYTRKYEFYAPGWETNWPVGLKTSRYYTTPDWTVGNNAYMSEKLVWQFYDGDPDDLYARGYNNAINNLDLYGYYPSNLLFGNGLPYIRTGHWYKMETWMVLNSSDGARDGVLQIWIDDKLVYDNHSVPWVDSNRGVTAGLGGWQSMWFGGNYSGATFGDPSTTVYRYIDDIYVSTTLDRGPRPMPPALSEAQ